MLLEILVGFVMWIVTLISYLIPTFSVPPELVGHADSLMDFVVQAAGIVKYLFGPAITWLANLGIVLIGARLMFNVLYLVFRWIPFIDVGGD